MKKTICLFAFAAVVLASCKKSGTTNVYTEQQPAYIVEGLHDVTMANGTGYYYNMPITVTYEDSAQNEVSLSLSALPSGVVIDTTWITNGIPTFSTAVIFYDTTSKGATPGTYPITLTATSVNSKKTYQFNLKINAAPPCTAAVVGAYSLCSYSCGTGTIYKDSVYNDPTVSNKIWFTNFANTGAKIYGNYSCTADNITIPSQTIGGITYSGTLNTDGEHYISGEINSGSSFCSINMEE